MLKRIEARKKVLNLYIYIYMSYLHLYNMMCGYMKAIILCKENIGSSCLFFQETQISVCM